MKASPETLKAFCKFWWDPDPNDGWDVEKWIAERRAIWEHQPDWEQELTGIIRTYAGYWNTGRYFLGDKTATERGVEEVNLDDAEEMAENFLASLRKDKQ